jgi:hypothetical protein
MSYKYGILKSAVNTGLDSELQCAFSTPLSVISNQPSYVQDMMSLKRKTNSQNVQRWEIEANLEPTNDSANHLVHSVVNGHNTPISVRMPQVYGISSTAHLPSQVVGTVNQGSDTLVLAGGLPIVGEFIQFTGDTKVYLTIESSVDTIRVLPQLRQTVPDTTLLIKGANVTLRAYYDATVRLGITYIDGVLSDPGSVTLIEALS